VKTVCIARLRSNVKYVEPLNHILDFWYEHNREYVREKSDQSKFTFYNYSHGEKTTRDLKAIEEADFIIITSEAEFQYLIPGYIHTLDLKASNEHVAKINEIIQNSEKQLIILQTDRKDSVELYRTKTFPGLSIPIHVIDETDFKGTICGTRYWIIDEYQSGSKLISRKDVSEVPKSYDFCYYGCDKSKDVGGVKPNDERADILKRFFKDETVASFFICRFKGFKPHMKWQKMKDVIPPLQNSRATLCFNWPGFTKYPTSRYAEALACYTVPLVWKDYDETNMVVCIPWQRCRTYEELVAKIEQLKNPEFFNTTYNQILNIYLSTKIHSKHEYYEQVKNKLDTIMN